ncbi:MAG: hypothetical protein U0802_14740 [Candidatus Binatia bacterium]
MGSRRVCSAIARACPAGATCQFGSDAGWGPWSIDAGPGVTNFTVAPPPARAGTGNSLRFFGTGGDIDRVKIRSTHRRARSTSAATSPSNSG